MSYMFIASGSIPMEEYTRILKIDLNKPYTADDIKNLCETIDDVYNQFMKLKKYDKNTFEIIGQLPSPIDGDKTEYLKVEINKIDEDYLIDLKIDLDGKSGSEKELEIETE